MMADGSSIDLTGKSFQEQRYCFVLTFNQEGRVTKFEGLLDFAELGRLSGSQTFAVASAAGALYPEKKLQ